MTFGVRAAISSGILSTVLVPVDAADVAAGMEAVRQQIGPDLSDFVVLPERQVAVEIRQLAAAIFRERYCGVSLNGSSPICWDFDPMIRPRT